MRVQEEVGRSDVFWVSALCLANSRILRHGFRSHSRTGGQRNLCFLSGMCLRRVARGRLACSTLLPNADLCYGWSAIDHSVARYQGAIGS